MSFPSMVLILVLVAVFGPSILTVTVVIGVLGWTAIAKLIYGNVLSIREREYIQAARAVGVSTKKILFSEVLPNAIPPVWANISFRVAGAILTESSLSFLGMGVQTPQASWGNIIFAAQNLLVLTPDPGYGFLRESASSWWSSALTSSEKACGTHWIRKQRNK